MCIRMTCLCQTHFWYVYRVDGTVVDNIGSIVAGVVTAVRVPLQLSNEGDEVAVQPIISFNLPQGTRFIRAFSNSSVSIQ